MRYKLRMLGVPLDGHAHIRVDNMSVVKNSSVPESVLKKKSNSIAYHFCREAMAVEKLWQLELERWHMSQQVRIKRIFSQSVIVDQNVFVLFRVYYFNLF